MANATATKERAPTYYVGTVFYKFRDDEAQCKDCDWSWLYEGVWSQGGVFKAKAHVRRTGHAVIFKKVEMREYFGQPR